MKEQIAFFKTGKETEIKKTAISNTAVNNRRIVKTEKTHISQHLKNEVKGFALDLSDKKANLDAEYQKF
jgi:hypothetical protein